MNTVAMTEHEFEAISAMVNKNAGIFLPEAKRYLVYNRLVNRLRTLEIDTFSKYLSYVSGRESEFRMMIDLLTTNETYFFREPQHFDFLKETARAEVSDRRPFRVWSAACSTGQEPYSIAMTLAEAAGPGRFEIVGSDISESVLNTARRGIYQMNRKDIIPPAYLKKFCLRGVRSRDGYFAVHHSLKEAINFMHINLSDELPRIGMFDVVFLRNVLIYFQEDMKRRVIGKVLAHLRKGGYLIVSHTESLIGMGQDMAIVKKKSSVYRKG